MVFIIVACMTKPSLSGLGNAFLFWGVPAGEGGNVAWYLIALVGNAIAPWMIFYQNSAYMEERNHLQGTAQRSDRHCDWLYLSSSSRNVYHHHRRRSVRKNDQSGTGWTAELIAALEVHVGFAASLLFGLGLFNAGLLAAITVSLLHPGR